MNFTDLLWFIGNFLINNPTYLLTCLYGGRDPLISSLSGAENSELQ